MHVEAEPLVSGHWEGEKPTLAMLSEHEGQRSFLNNPEAKGGRRCCSLSVRTWGFVLLSNGPERRGALGYRRERLDATLRPVPSRRHCS